MRKILTTLLFAIICTAASAQGLVFNGIMEMRGDLKYRQTGSDPGKFFTEPKDFNVEMRGTFGQGFEYRYRNRMARWARGEKFFEATDICYLGWQPGEHLRFRAGRGFLNVGGYEYDSSPLDIFYLSEYINNFDCYQYAFDVDWLMGDDRIGIEFSKSPLMKGKAVNVIWNGRFSVFETVWSANLFEYAPGSYMRLANTGTSATLGLVRLSLDAVSRFEKGGARKCLDDVTLIGKAIWTVSDKLRFTAYTAWDRNATGSAFDGFVADDTNVTNLAALAEFFPTGSPDFRFHIAANHRTGRVAGNPILDNTINFGLTCRVRTTKRLPANGK